MMQPLGESACERRQPFGRPFSLNDSSNPTHASGMPLINRFVTGFHKPISTLCQAMVSDRVAGEPGHLISTGQWKVRCALHRNEQRLFRFRWNEPSVQFSTNK